MSGGIDISTFCSPHRDDHRVYVKNPWNMDGQTIATDSRVLISIAENPQYHQGTEEKYPVDAVRKLMDGWEKREYGPLKYTEPLGKICQKCAGAGLLYIEWCFECDGEGEIEFSTRYHDYYCECKSCRGSGHRYHQDPKGKDVCPDCNGGGIIFPKIDVGGSHFYRNHLLKLHPIKGLEVSIDRSTKRMFFRGSECHGVIMGHNPS